MNSYNDVSALLRGLSLERIYIYQSPFKVRILYMDNGVLVYLEHFSLFVSKKAVSFRVVFMGAWIIIT